MARRTLVSGLALALMVTTVGRAFAVEFSVLTYNIRGLPVPAIEDRTAEIAAIAPLLEDFHTAGGTIVGGPSVVLLQELFFQGYYDTLTNPLTVSYPNKTAKDSSGPNGIGDGLNMLSDFTFTGFDRTQWEDCFGTGGANGSDCDTNKGYSFARYSIDGLSVDIYNLHADAGQDTDSQFARRGNIDQLIDAINTRSPEGTAFIVMGDTNSRYTRTPDDTIESIPLGTGATDVWVELVNAGITPGAGPDIDSGCAADPASSTCELIDKVFYRSGDSVTLSALNYEVLNEEFSDAGGDLSDHFPVTVRFSITAASTTTTSTTSTTVGGSTTTTTLDSGGTCADPVPLTAGEDFSADAVTASDALFTLRAGIGLESCALCVCDADNSGNVSATDALTILRAAVGQPVTLNCPACDS
jgi:hypothetical protein